MGCPQKEIKGGVIVGLINAAEPKKVEKTEEKPVVQEKTEPKKAKK